jgi:hypothetical protein
MGSAISAPMADEFDFSPDRRLKRNRDGDSAEAEPHETSGKRHCPDEIIILDDDDDLPTLRKGAGTQHDPITFCQWSTESLIPNDQHGNYFIIDDDDDSDNENHEERALFFDTPSPTIQSTTQSSVSSQNERTSLLIFRNPWKPQGEVALNSIFDQHNGHGNDNDANDNETDANDEASDNRVEDEDADDDQDPIIAFGEVRSSQLSQKSVVYGIEEKEEDELPSLSFSQSTSKEIEKYTPPPQYPFLSRPPEERYTFQEPSDKKVVLTLPYNNDPTSKSTAEFLGDKLKIIRARKRPSYSTDIKVRKRLFYSTYWKEQVPTLKRLLGDHQAHVKDEEGGECHLYCGPKVRGSRGVLRVGISFHHNGKVENLHVNIGLIAVLLNDRLTHDQMEGIIDKAWHCSHLCGNFTCINPEHITVEPGRINQERNVCFRDKYGPCKHSPACIKHLKIPVKDLQPNATLDESQPKVHF